MKIKNVVFISIFMFVIGYFICLYQKDRQIEEKEKEYSLALEEQAKNYKQKIQFYHDQLLSYTQNDIVTNKIIIRKNGEQIITQKIDKSNIKSNKMGRTILEDKEGSVEKKRLKEDKKEEIKVRDNSSFTHYILGVSSPQEFNVKNLSLEAGMRFLETPIFLVVNCRLFDFEAKKINIGMQINF